MAWHPSPAVRTAAGAAGLAVAMGIGRFAYTALLPSVQRAHGLDDAAGGLIASANLTGYLVGVLWARRTPPGAPRIWLLRLGLAASVLTTTAAVVASALAGWLLVRFAAGVASGLVFVLVSAAVLEALPRGREALAGLLFSGVGLGIALSGLVAAATAAAPWQLPWQLLGAAALLLALPGLLMAPGTPVLHLAPGEAKHDGVSFGRLAVAYGLEGLGYIVSGTFAVRAVQQTPGLARWAPWVWVAAGLAAAPSAALWGWAARRLGLRWALTAAFATQAIGMAAPALSSSGAAAVLGALFFGGTFIGIVTLTVDLARRLMPEASVRAIGSLTAVYGVGQAIGPYLAGRLTQAVGHPAPAVLAAAGAVAVGAVVLAWPAADEGEDEAN